MSLPTGFMPIEAPIRPRISRTTLSAEPAGDGRTIYLGQHTTWGFYAANAIAADRRRGSASVWREHLTNSARPTVSPEQPSYDG
ncbi:MULTISPECIES: hypothetical protein [unclassified Mesorhizobium]|uniref:hypothetical protein n=1 Tax=unclassified Mesorhizobium TaxID=325217 RepID=UPI0033369545